MDKAAQWNAKTFSVNSTLQVDRPDRHIGYEVTTHNYPEQTNHAGGT